MRQQRRIIARNRLGRAEKTCCVGSTGITWLFCAEEGTIGTLLASRLWTTGSSSRPIFQNEFGSRPLARLISPTFETASVDPSRDLSMDDDIDPRPHKNLLGEITELSEAAVASAQDRSANVTVHSSVGQGPRRHFPSKNMYASPWWTFPAGAVGPGRTLASNLGKASRSRRTQEGRG